MEGAPVIISEGLTKRYGSQIAVNHLDLTVNQGEIFGYLGPNGAGKTTSILMFLGLTEPTSGKVTVCGFDPRMESIRVKENTGYLPENVGFYDDLNAVENLLFVARLNHIPDKISKPKISALLEDVGLLGEKRKRVGAFSKGMRQRLGIAEVLLKEPRLAFLDEPTIGLDPDGTNQMLELIQALARNKGITVFLSSHLLDQVQRICDRVGIMIKGKLVACGSIDSLGKEKFGIEKEEYTLEEVYMKFFKEAKG
jgi:ABC-2 type transport system ATP-binding protein